MSRREARTQRAPGASSDGSRRLGHRFTRDHRRESAGTIVRCSGEPGNEATGKVSDLGASDDEQHDRDSTESEDLKSVADGPPPRTLEIAAITMITATTSGNLRTSIAPPRPSLPTENSSPATRHDPAAIETITGASPLRPAKAATKSPARPMIQASLVGGSDLAPRPR